MKNDIDSLLNSIFSNGRFHFSGKEPQPSSSDADIRQIQKNVADISAEIERQTRELEQPGSPSAPATIPAQPSPADVSKPADPILAFNGLASELEKTVFGQSEFLKKLVVAFKRPCVSGTVHPLKNSILVTGARGTGKHSAVAAITKALHQRRLFACGEPAVVDLSLYPTQNETRLFLQDLYMALQGPSPVLVLEHYEQCHPALLSMLSSLAQNGAIALQSRYVLQKGILVDAGTALTANAIGSITANGQYLVLITENSREKVADAFGASFIRALGDIAETASLDKAARLAIARRLLDALCRKAKETLAFTINCPQGITEHLAAQCSKEDGAHAMVRYCGDCFRALGEYRLQQDTAQPCEVTLSLQQDVLYADFGSGTVALFSLLAPDLCHSLDTVKAKLDRIVGLHEVKDYILSLEQNYQVQAMRKAQGLIASTPSMHMIFTGNPGTGKTTIARLVSQYLKAIGALSGGQLVEVTRADLVGRYVGHTAPLTTQVIQSALGGVLFIDEAYSLYRGKEDSFGLEAIDTLVKGMEDHRDNLVVILAGYTKEMQEFLSANSGLRSRFPNQIEFPDYTGDELLQIALMTAEGKGYRIAEDCQSALLDYFTLVQASGSRDSGNGRLVRNKIEEAILNLSRRILAEPGTSLDLLTLRDFELESRP